METILKEGLAQLGLDTGSIPALTEFSRRLLEKNQVMNLTAITEPADVARLHLLDCACLLTAADFRSLDASMKGSEALFSVYSNADYEIPAQSETAQLNETALSYLEKIIALCGEHGAQLVLTALPFGDAHEDAIPRQQTANAVEQYAREHGIPFLNYIYLNDETGLDMAADFANIDHLNARGAVKISQHLAGYLKENYDLPDRRDDGAYRAWNDDCASYEQMLKDGWGAETK